MKVAFYLRNIASARGAEQAATAVAMGLARRGHDVSFLLEELGGFLVEELAANDPPVRVVDLRARADDAIDARLAQAQVAFRALLGPRGLVGSSSEWLPPLVRMLLGDAPPIAALRRFVESERPDAVIAHLSYPDLVAALVAPLCDAPTRFVVTVQNHLSAAARHSKSRWVRAVPALVRRFYPDADAVVAASRGVADDVAALVGDTVPVRVIHNPGFAPDADALARDATGHPWLDEAGPPVVLAVGKLKPQKDFETLLRAFRALREKRAARLVILGEGDEHDALVALAENLGIADDVALLGFVRNPYPFYARASVFALSSIFEGFGNVVAEALACGCPVVSTDCPSGPAEILGEGRYGRLVPVRDADAFAQALAATLDAPPSRDALRARARAFALDTVLDEWEALLRVESLS